MLELAGLVLAAAGLSAPGATPATPSDDERGFESTLAGGLKLYHRPGGEGPLEVVLLLDRGLAHAAVAREEAPATAAFAACLAGQDAWTGELEALNVEFRTSVPEAELQARLAELAFRLGGELPVPEGDSGPTEDAGWDRFREAAFPRSAIGLARRAEAPFDAAAAADFVAREWGPEGAVLVVLGGEHDGVHHAASRAFAPWSRARSPGARFPVSAAPRRSRVLPAPSGAEGWLGYWVDAGVSLEDRLCCEALLATVGDRWPRRLHAASAVLMGVPGGSDPAGRHERLRQQAEQGQGASAGIRQALRVRLEHLGSDRGEAARSHARSALEEDDPDARRVALGRLLEEDEDAFARRLRALPSLLPGSHRIVVGG